MQSAAISVKKYIHRGAIALNQVGYDLMGAAFKVNIELCTDFGNANLHLSNANPCLDSAGTDFCPHILGDHDLKIQVF